MWQYNKQIESGEGCTRQEVCSGSATYKVFEEDGRTLQFFCTDEQIQENEGSTMPYNGLTLLPDKKWDSFEIVCQTDSDCDMDPDKVQHCLDYYWDMVTEPQALQGSSYQQG